jgi:hypothetical protein
VEQLLGSDYLTFACWLRDRSEPRFPNGFRDRLNVDLVSCDEACHSRLAACEPLEPDPIAF